MSQTLYIANWFDLMTAAGVPVRGKHGEATGSFNEPFAVTVAGTAHYKPGSLATAAVETVYDDDDDLPSDWDFLYYWADQVSYIQLIGPTMSVTHKVAAKIPFVLPGYDSILAAASASPITGVSEPTLSDIDSVVIGNYSGSTMNYLFAVVD